VVVKCTVEATAEQVCHWTSHMAATSCGAEQQEQQRRGLSVHAVRVLVC
jgi:hypothetical protein